MTADLSGVLVFVMGVVAVLILAAVLAYATYRRGRREAADRARMEALHRGEDLHQTG